MIASEALEASRRRQNHMLREQKTFFQFGERRKEFFTRQTHSDMQSQVAEAQFGKVVHEEEVQLEQELENTRTVEAQLRVQYHSEEQKMASMVESLKETSESERQAGKTRSTNHVIFQGGSVRRDISLWFLEEGSRKTRQRKGGGCLGASGRQLPAPSRVTTRDASKKRIANS